MILRHSFQRQLNLLDYALGSLTRKKTKNFGMVIVFSLVIFLFSSLLLLSRGLSELATEVLQHAPDITVQQLSAGRQVALRADAAAQLENIFGIRSVTSRIWGYYFDEGNGANYTVVGLDVTPSELPGISAEARAGHWPKNGEMQGVVLSAGVRRTMGLGDRRSFSLFRPDLELVSFTTKGVFDNRTAPVTADMMLVSLAAARNLFGMEEDQITDLLVSVGNPRETETIAGKIAERLPGVRVLTRNQILKTYNVVFGWRSGFGSICLLASLTAFAILAYDKASGLSKEDVREVAILKVLGWQTADVMAVRFWESALVSLTAFFLGYSLAWVHLLWGQGALFQPLLLGWSVLRPELHLVPPILAEDILLIVAITVLPYLCATVVPAWRSSVVRADTVV